MSYNGILRKRTAPAADAAETRKVDLLVFGYACKVFRDDAKALEIDQGKHLIDWMGDSGLKIDRYDVRGALYELASHEPPSGGYGNRLEYLNADEQRAEQLCEEERYLYLYNNEEDHILQQEEDLKRLQEESGGRMYSRVGYQYDNEITDNGSNNNSTEQGPQREGNTNSPTNDDGEQPFRLPDKFEVPETVVLPETMKQHAIIEKTARFIASQGMQMEILLKAKQSNNVQFEFLNQSGNLNPYYKHMLDAMKNGTYPEQIQKTNATEQSESVNSTGTSMNNAENLEALVPSKPVITVPIIKYKPSPNCAYTQLISKIKGLPLPQVLQENDNASSVGSPASINSANDRFTPVLLQYNGNTFITADEEDSNSNSNSNSNSQFAKLPTGEVKVEVLKSSSALALAQDYSSDSEEIEEDEPTVKPPSPVLNFPVPTENLKNIIDKTATYVIKNGRQFEETLRTKSEERFTFLIPDNEYYPYYMYKITGDPDAASKEQKTRKAAAVAAALLSKKGLKTDQTKSPVSFSIKPKDDLTTVHPALPQEASDEDEDKDNDHTKLNSGKGYMARAVPESVQKAIQLVESQLMAKNAQLVVLGAMGGAASGSSVRSRFDIDPGNVHKLQAKTSKSDIERNALFEQQQQNRQKELRKAEEKVKDKLAQKAREKLSGLLSKEKQLQLERKRKAMAFLHQIKETSSSGEIPANSNESGTAKLNENDIEENVSEDSNASVHSIPITSYGPEAKTDDEDDEAKQIRLPYHLALPPTMRPPSESSEIVAIQRPSLATLSNRVVLLSDDDDVQLIGEDRPLRKASANARRRRRSRSRSLSHSNSRPSVRKHRRKQRKRSHSYSSDASHSSAASVNRHKRSTQSNKSLDRDKSRRSDRHHTHRHKDKSKKSKKTSSRRRHSRSRSRTPYSRSPSKDSVVSARTHQRQKRTESRHTDRNQKDK